MDNVSDGLLAIGTLSRASLLSIKKLRAYHEAGILVPASVDPHTGYRSYHSSQLTDAAVIRRLRALDLPLDQVREVIQARDPALTGRVLAAHGVSMRERLTDVTRIVTELQAGIERPASHTPVHRRDEPHSHTLTIRERVTEADFGQFLGDAYAQLDAMAARLGVAPSGPSGALYPPEIADENLEEVEAYLPLPKSVALRSADGSVLVSEVPAAHVAVLVHVGPYEAISDTYRQLGAWVAEHAEPAALPIREVYVVSYGDTDDVDRFRTEIQWPIHRVDNKETPS